MKRLIICFSHLSYNFLSFWPTHSTQLFNLLSTHQNLLFMVRHQVLLHPYRTRCKLIVLYILIFFCFVFFTIFTCFILFMLFNLMLLFQSVIYLFQFHVPHIRRDFLLRSDNSIRPTYMKFLGTDGLNKCLKKLRASIHLHSL